MAAELPYASDDPTCKPAAAADTTSGVSISRVTVAILVFLAVNLALNVRSFQQGDYDPAVGFAFIVFLHLNLALIVCALRSLLVAPQGSPAHGRAKLVVWLLTTMLIDAFIWKSGEVLALPPGLVVAGWVVAAVMHAGGFYLIFVYGDEKPSAESLSIMRDCEKDGGDLSVLAS